MKLAERGSARKQFASIRYRSILPQKPGEIQLLWFVTIRLYSLQSVGSMGESMGGWRVR
jgi:hypothetical protein